MTEFSSPNTSPDDAENNPTITIADLKNAVRIIDKAVERGAFRGAELSKVGMVRDRYTRFLEAVGESDAHTGIGETPQ